MEGAAPGHEHAGLWRAISGRAAPTLSHTGRIAAPPLIYAAPMNNSVVPLSLLAGAVHFDESQPGWTLRDPIEEAGRARSCSGRVTFERPFSAPPVVQIG